MSTPTSSLRVGLTLVKAAVLGALLALLVAGGLRTSGHLGAEPGSSAAPATPAALVAGPDQVLLDRVLSSGTCRTEGYGGTAVPGSALVRTPVGRVRVVGFDAGWAVLAGRRPGQLLAVCLADRAATRARLRAWVRMGP